MKLNEQGLIRRILKTPWKQIPVQTTCNKIQCEHLQQLQGVIQVPPEPCVAICFPNLPSIEKKPTLNWLLSGYPTPIRRVRIIGCQQLIQYHTLLSLSHTQTKLYCVFDEKLKVVQVTLFHKPNSSINQKNVSHDLPHTARVTPKKSSELHWKTLPHHFTK